MNDDLNTSIGLSVLFDITRLANKLLADADTTRGTLQAADNMYRLLGGDVLGVVKDQYAQASAGDDELLDHLISMAIQQRHDARAKKDFAASDAIRDKLTELGIVLEDKPDGSCDWRRK
jgi:cysteinyl-tRNA synthetase